MKRIFTILHTLYIAYASGVAIYAIYIGNVKSLWLSDQAWWIGVAASIIMVCLAICAIGSLVSKSTKVTTFQILWWLPQLVLVDVMKFSAIGQSGILYHIYYPVMRIALAFGFTWGDQSEMYGVKINVIALAGIILAKKTRQYIRPNQKLEPTR